MKISLKNMIVKKEILPRFNGDIMGIWALQYLQDLIGEMSMDKNYLLTIIMKSFPNTLHKIEYRTQMDSKQEAEDEFWWQDWIREVGTNNLEIISTEEVDDFGKNWEKHTEIELTEEEYLGLVNFYGK